MTFDELYNKEKRRVECADNICILCPLNKLVNMPMNEFCIIHNIPFDNNNDYSTLGNSCTEAWKYINNRNELYKAWSEL